MNAQLESLRALFSLDFDMKFIRERNGPQLQRILENQRKSLLVAVNALDDVHRDASHIPDDAMIRSTSEKAIQDILSQITNQ